MTAENHFPSRSSFRSRRRSGPSRRRRPLIASIFLAAACTSLAVSCSQEDPDASADAGSSATGGDEPEVVRIVTYEAFALPEQAAAAFEEQTGATIEVVATGDANTMLSKALLSAGAPEGDVIFGIDNISASEAANEELLERWTPEAAEALDPEFDPPAVVADSLTPIDTSEVCVNIDTSWFDSAGVAPPATFDDLAADEYRDLLSVQSPVTSSPGMAFLLGTVETYGEDGFIGYWQELADNGVRVSPSWDDAYYGDYTVNGGDRPLVVSYASSPPAEVVFSEGERTEPASGVLEDTCVTQVEYAGVLTGAENPDLARELLEFMLTDEWQSALPLTNFVYPVTDAPLPPEFDQWAPRPQDPTKVDVEAVSELRDEWLEQWRSAME